jgi:pimeloyl-ACP methyl ester carboxylesterase
MIVRLFQFVALVTGQQRPLRTLMLAIVLLVAVFVLMCAYLYVQQDKLLFFPRPNDAALTREWADRRVEIRTPETTLVGWWARGGAPESGIVILYFGGNAEDVLYTASTAERLAAERVLLVNYRGYGSTAGKPSQAALFADALALYEHVRASGVSPNRIVAMGRSLGSSVATMLAANRPLRGVVLITPFDSLAEVAARHYRWFPVRTLLRHPFPSVEFARRTNVPALLLAAEGDFIVPPAHAQRLSEAWAGPHRLVMLDAVGHNDIEQHADYYDAINAFLREADST